MLVAIFVEEPEYGGGGISEKIHEDGSPKDPSKVSSFLFSVSVMALASPIVIQILLTFAITFAVDFPTNPPIYNTLAPCQSR